MGRRAAAGCASVQTLMPGSAPRRPNPDANRPEPAARPRSRSHGCGDRVFERFWCEAGEIIRGSSSGWHSGVVNVRQAASRPGGSIALHPGLDDRSCQFVPKVLRQQKLEVGLKYQLHGGALRDLSSSFAQASRRSELFQSVGILRSLDSLILEQDGHQLRPAFLPSRTMSTPSQPRPL